MHVIIIHVTFIVGYTELCSLKKNGHSLANPGHYAIKT